MNISEIHLISTYFFLKKGTTMNITEKHQKKAAKEFAEYWKDKGYEKGQSQTFWIELLQKVFGVEDATHFISFEDQVHIDKSTGFIDGYMADIDLYVELQRIRHAEDREKEIDFAIKTCQSMGI